MAHILHLIKLPKRQLFKEYNMSTYIMNILNKTRDAVKKSVLNAQKGFTLVELLIVISIISVISAIAAPGLIGAVNHYKFQSGVSDITGVFNWARLTAITKNTYVKINVVVVNEGTTGVSSYSVTSFNRDGATWDPVTGKSYELLPRNLNLLDPLGGFELAYRPDGSAVCTTCGGLGTALPAGFAMNSPALNACFSNSKDSSDTMRVAVDQFTGRLVTVGQCI